MRPYSSKSVSLAHKSSMGASPSGLAPLVMGISKMLEIGYFCFTVSYASWKALVFPVGFNIMMYCWTLWFESS